MAYERGVVVKGPDLFADYDYRPYVCLSDDSHPFSDEEALYAAITTTSRDAAIPITDEDFTTGSLPRESYVNRGLSCQSGMPISRPKKVVSLRKPLKRSPLRLLAISVFGSSNQNWFGYNRRDSSSIPSINFGLG